MDIKREVKPSRRKYFIGGGALVLVVAATVALRRLPQAAPNVERGTLWVDTVRRGEMIRKVSGTGTLVPEHIRIVSAVTAGRVEQLAMRPGVTVTKETVILDLVNPDEQLQLLEAQRGLTEAEGQLVNLRSTLESQRLNQQATVASLKTEFEQAKRGLTVAAAPGILSTNEVAQARDKAEELKSRMNIEQQRLTVLTEQTESQIKLQKEQVERLRAILRFRQERIEAMHVKAGEDGVLQEMNLEQGQWVVPGQQLAKVAQPGRLKAVLRIQEGQAKDVVLAQPVAVDTHNGIIPGKVIRIDPQSQGGTVLVDVGLEGQLPPGARPELSVDGTVEIERLPDVLYVARPAFGQAESTVGFFRLAPDGKEASRVSVKLGRGSVNTIEIKSGLKIGDIVIISDMSNWDAFDRVRLR